MNMKKTVLLMLALAWIMQIGAKDKLSGTSLPIPTPAQLNWQDAELVAVFHYDLHVFDGKQYEQKSNRITPIQDINIYNPKQLDTDQWVRSVKAMGAKIAVITATHETGFANYQSDVNPYCMKALKWRDGKGDLVRDFVSSCRKYGIQPGIYIGIRWNAFMGIYDYRMPDDGTDFQKNRQKFYDKMCEGMTEELMSRYGDLAMVWYDGGVNERGTVDVQSIVERHQKNIIFYRNTVRSDIRWGYSETGMVPYPCWGNYPLPSSLYKGKVEKVLKPNFRKHGDPDGEYYMPAMSDAPLRGYNGRHEWFWEPGDEAHVFPLSHLMKMYVNSVGHNSTLILGVTPDARGLVPEVDAQRLKEFGDEIIRRFSSPIAATHGQGKRFTLKLKAPVTIDAIILSEDIRQGERIRSYELEGKVDGKWQTLSKGSCVGHKRIEDLQPIQVTAVRLIVNESVGQPILKDFSVYSSSKQ